MSVCKRCLAEISPEQEESDGLCRECAYEESDRASREPDEICETIEVSVWNDDPEKPQWQSIAERILETEGAADIVSGLLAKVTWHYMKSYENLFQTKQDALRAALTDAAHNHVTGVPVKVR